MKSIQNPLLVLAAGLALASLAFAADGKDAKSTEKSKEECCDQCCAAACCADDCAKQCVETATAKGAEVTAAKK